MLGAILISIAFVAVVTAIVYKRVKSKKVKSNDSDHYNGFHLGEMTSHDIPLPAVKREQEYARWSSRNDKLNEKISNKKGEYR